MIIDKTAFEECLAHLIAEARLDREGVGLLSARLDAPARRGPIQPNGANLITNQTAEWWTPLANVAEFPRFRYEVDPDELLAAYNALEGAGMRPAVIVHSHLIGGAVPSVNDVRYAADPAVLHMVVDMAARRPHAVLWHLDPTLPVAEQMKIRYQVADLRQQRTSAEDLTRGVTED